MESEALGFNLALDSPFFFTCMRCCACCYHRHIELNNYELYYLARYLRLPRPEVLTRFFSPGRRPVIKNKQDGSCIFLSPSGCSIHPARPLVCRLYPLALLFGEGGKEKWGMMPLHPDCVGLVSPEATVEDYLQSQGAIFFLRFERRLRRLPCLLRPYLLA